MNRNQKLNQLNEALDAKVKDRTMQLEQTNERLEQSNRELRDFAYVVLHDLQEPLRMISTYSEMLDKTYQDQLEGNTYYYTVSAVADGYHYLYDTSCNRLCAPDGGFSGTGKGECPNFKGDIKRTLIWSDDDD
jgi:signal transduction histidine kinase